MKKFKGIILLALLIILTGCGNSNNADANKKVEENTANVETKIDNKTSDEVIKVGVIGSSKVWDYVKEEAAKEGINIEIVSFDSYTLPNAALASGEIDLNAFQHKAYLKKESEQLGYDLTPIATTYIAPIGLYSEKIKSIDELKDGDTIIIPDDVTNGGRSLKLLEANGLIKVDESAGLTPTLKDIENPRNFNFIELEAANTPSALKEATLVAINSGFAVDSGLSPNDDAVILEDHNNIDPDNPYVNIIVARTEEKDNPTFKRIVEIFQTDEVVEINNEESKGATYPVW